MSVPTVSLYGIALSKMNMDQTVDYLTSIVEKRIPHQVVTANPIMFMDALKDPDYMKMMRHAELVIPDGTGLVWAASRVGQPVAERVPGIELFHRLAEQGGRAGWRIYLLGASPEVIRICSTRLAEQYPGLQVVGARDGFFRDDQNDEIIADIVAAAPDLLFVANAPSRQEPWIGRYKARLGVPVMMGVGGSFDVLAGKSKRAPKLFRQMRLEWLYRLLREPWRYKRMLVLPQFVMRVLRENPLTSKNENLPNR